MASDQYFNADGTRRINWHSGQTGLKSDQAIKAWPFYCAASKRIMSSSYSNAKSHSPNNIIDRENNRFSLRIV
ncbi:MULTISPECIES: hypothetical protein [Serratia]|uniref:hypothetical protein n=1 Tax=Serratia TaxID=613 RepID=UPI0018D94759|nr:hypothetical protein [Serratia marcescens]MBH2872865.1 hypothetical protein [Serratia marcescens]MBI6129185.1 hypothetical protein [Serratia marcescens]MBN5183924.1 hypothetical protein [Serratia marcescens]MBN5196420.1 hypothetical protein [Serratia marcescens]MBN5299716.1 hypothetical protein [Serratia marcescens]